MISGCPVNMTLIPQYTEVDEIEERCRSDLQIREQELIASQRECQSLHQKLALLERDFKVSCPCSFDLMIQTMEIEVMRRMEQKAEDAKKSVSLWNLSYLIGTVFGLSLLSSLNNNFVSVFKFETSLTPPPPSTWRKLTKSKPDSSAISKSVIKRSSLGTQRSWSSRTKLPRWKESSRCVWDFFFFLSFITGAVA